MVDLATTRVIFTLLLFYPSVTGPTAGRKNSFHNPWDQAEVCAFAHFALIWHVVNRALISTYPFSDCCRLSLDLPEMISGLSDPAVDKLFQLSIFNLVQYHLIMFLRA